MKVEILRDGMMIIKAETELESYALSEWIKNNNDANCKNITIKWGLENEPCNPNK